MRAVDCMATVMESDFTIADLTYEKAIEHLLAITDKHDLRTVFQEVHRFDDENMMAGTRYRDEKRVAQCALVGAWRWACCDKLTTGAVIWRDHAPDKMVLYREVKVYGLEWMWKALKYAAETDHLAYEQAFSDAALDAGRASAGDDAEGRGD